ncbi:MAG: hypothetical protein DME72_07280, partial [Verrucomicrobia bacterium]
MAKILQRQIRESRDTQIGTATLIAIICAILASASTSSATTKGLSQIVTPDLQGPGDLSLSFQAQSEKIANPYE